MVTEAEARELAELTLATRSFEAFLSYVWIHDDDPVHPKMAPMEAWGFQAERARAWESGFWEIILKARQLGFSWLVAAYMVWRAMYFGWRVAYWSYKEEPALYELEERVLRIWERLPPRLKAPCHQDGTTLRFAGGGLIQVFPATVKAGLSYTFQLAIFDEWAFHAYGLANWGAVAPTLSEGRGQALLISTANPELGQAGHFYDEWQAAELGESAFVPVFCRWNLRPGRDAAWLAARRREHKGLPESFDAWYPDSPGQAFVGRAGLVYPQFSLERHSNARDPVPVERVLYWYIGYDLGGGDPTGEALIGIYRHGDGFLHAFQFDEWWKPTGVPGTAELYEAMLPWLTTRRITSIEADPAQPSVAQDLRALVGGVSVRIADWRREEGLGLVGEWLSKDWLAISSVRCPRSLAEFGNYLWLKRTDPNAKDRYATATPLDRHGDLMDARRYAMMGARRDLMAATDRRTAYSEVRL